jgi:hypothetical protein
MADVVRLDGASGFHAENEAVERHAKAPEEKEGRAVLGYKRKNGSRQGNLKGVGVTSGEIVDDAREKHIKKAAANLVLPVRTDAAGELHLGNGFAAKGALRQMRGNVLATKHATALIHDRSRYRTHAASHRLSSLKARFGAVESSRDAVRKSKSQPRNIVKQLETSPKAGRMPLKET